MSYYISTKLHVPFDTAVEQTEAPLKVEGFGVIGRIDIQQTPKTKINANFHSYTILEACNPKLVHKALQLENKVGTMLPCNVVVQQLESGEAKIAAINPVASM